MIPGVQATKLRVLLVSGLLTIASMNFLSGQTTQQTSKDSESDKAQRAESNPGGRGYGLYLTSDGAVQARNRAAFAVQPVAVAQRSGHAHGQVAFAGDTAALTIGLTGRGSEAASPSDEGKLPDAVHSSADFDLLQRGDQRQLGSDPAFSLYADPKQTRLEFSEVSKAQFDADNDLVASANEFAFSKQATYQENGRRDWLAGRFTLGKRHRLNLSLSGDAPPQPLVNDPALTNSTSIGNSGSDGYAARALAVD
jgi:hypothetical protein